MLLYKLKIQNHRSKRRQESEIAKKTKGKVAKQVKTMSKMGKRMNT